MIKSKKVSAIKLDGVNPHKGYRSAAFGVYLNLLDKFDSKELFLLESLGPGSIDTKVSLIGVNPVLNVKVFDRIVAISGNQELLKEIKLLYEGEILVESSGQMLRYQLGSRNAVWEFLRSLDDKFKAVEGGIFAFVAFAYNTIYFIEDIPGYRQGDIPDICLTCYSTYIEFEDERVMLHEYEFSGAKCIGFLEISSCLSFGEVVPDVFVKTKFVVAKETLKNNYLQKAAVALQHVQVGDVYQIQIGQKITVKADISALDVYARLRLLNPSPYMYLFDCGHSKVIGASPELFVYMKDQDVMMRPIAGTLGKSIATTKEIAESEFYKNPKEIAGHMMLVDLCRNDLCKVSLPQTLGVSELMSVEEYSHVYHMISTAKSLARKGCDKYDVIKASFPAGTMTGTPKIRAIELISEIEDSSRGLYAGALGVIGLGHNYINTALCIRTAIECNHIFSLRASAGIVSDSIAESEYTETLHKMGSVFKAITNEEISCHVA
jgi:anthranilate synthase component 1